MDMMKYSNSRNRSNFLELLQVLVRNCDEIENMILQNASDNQKLISPDIQKDIVCTVAIEIRNAIVNDLGDEYFAIMVNESCDCQLKSRWQLSCAM